ncbi:hypothetical protein ES703_54537 [subsurface metagenome]
MSRAALYARVSTPAQGEEEKASIPEQISRIEGYCEENGYSIIERYVDIGYSGAKSKRPEFQRMLSDAKSQKFDVVVCWKADRLSRGMYPAAALMEVVEPLGIGIEAVEEKFDMNMFALLAVVGKMELDGIRTRTQMGKEARAKKGKMQGRAAFGYSYNIATGRYEICEKEAGIVRWIFDLYTQGIPVRQIVAKLNAAGIPTKENSRFGWTVAKLNDVLSKNFYCGEGYYNRRASRTNKQRLKEKEAWIPLEYPEIVSRETFEAALTRKEANKRFNPGHAKQIYLLRGLLFCDECGMRFYVSPRSGSHKYKLADGTEKVYHRKRNIGRYECRGLRDYPHIYNCRSPKQIWSDEIEPLVWEKLDEALRNPEVLRVAIQTRIEELEAGMNEESERKKEVTRNIDKLKLEEAWLITQARKGNITEQQMALQLKLVGEEREAWEADLHKIQQWKDLQAKREDMLQVAQRTCCQLLTRLDYLANSNDVKAMEEKQAIVALLVDKVTVNREGKVTITFAIPQLESEPSDIGAFTTSSPRRGGWHQW